MTPEISCVVIGGMTVSEAVTANDDGTFTVFINDSLSPSGKVKAYKHAVEHIRHEDFRSALQADQIEAERHKIKGGQDEGIL